MSDLHTRLTPLQVQKLGKHGIHTLYNLITNVPRNTISVTLLENVYIDTTLGGLYVWRGRLIGVEKKIGKRPYYILQWHGDTQQLNTFFFSTAKYIISSLVVGAEFDILLRGKNSFWTAEKISKPAIHTLKSYTQPLYEKSGELQSQFFQTVHKRLQPQDYNMGLTGLIPVNPYIPQKISLYGLHHPASRADFDRTLQQWILFKVFLRMTVLRYISLTTKQEYARSGILDRDFLDTIVSDLPFALSESQSTVVHEILSEITDTGESTSLL
jgi:RecG-like helicase